MIESLEEENWKRVFDYANGTDGRPSWALSRKECACFDRENVDSIFGISEGDHDGPNWLVTGRLINGNYFFIEAGCDYTGWDCKAGGSAWVCDSFSVLTQLAMDEYQRERLDLSSVAKTENVKKADVSEQDEFLTSRGHNPEILSAQGKAEVLFRTYQQDTDSVRKMMVDIKAQLAATKEKTRLLQIMVDNVTKKAKSRSNCLLGLLGMKQDLDGRV